MQWKEVKKTYPDKWVVFEAIDAHSDNNYRIVDDIAVWISNRCDSVI